MQRRKPLQRRTPLATKRTQGAPSGLRRTPLTRTPNAGLPPRRGGSASGTPSRSRPAPVPAELAQFVLERSEYRCDRCGKSIIGRPFSRQHRRARGAGGRKDGYLHTAANLIVLCGSATSPGCHAWAENEEREEAYRLGYAIRGEARDPAEVPLLRHGLVWQIPTEEGWVTVPAPLDQAA